MEKFSAGWAILFIGTMECICIGWVYGFENFRKDIEIMIGKQFTSLQVFWPWIGCWLFLIPGLLVALIIFSFIQYKPLDPRFFPHWVSFKFENCFKTLYLHIKYYRQAETLGWLMTAFIISGIVFWALFLLVDALIIRKRPLSTLFSPETNWGPLRTENKRQAVHLPNLAPFHEHYASNQNKNQNSYVKNSPRHV